MVKSPDCFGGSISLYLQESASKYIDFVSFQPVGSGLPNCELDPDHLGTVTYPSSISYVIVRYTTLLSMFIFMSSTTVF
jgi:hypothetical protein